MGVLRAEFTIEPFAAGRQGAHVQAAIDAARAAGFEVEVGPFGSSLEGSGPAVAGAVASIVQAAFAAGASRVSVQVEEARG